MNYASDYLQLTNQTVEDFDQQCLELADCVLHHLDDLHVVDGAIIFFEPSNPRSSIICSAYPDEHWGYHAAVWVGQRVHDALVAESLTLPAYLKHMFKHQTVRVTIFGETEEESLWFEDQQLRRNNGTKKTVEDHDRGLE